MKYGIILLLVLSICAETTEVKVKYSSKPLITPKVKSDFGNAHIMNAEPFGKGGGRTKRSKSGLYKFDEKKELGYAATGDTIAMYRLGRHYSKKKLYDKAWVYYKHAADSGCADAMYLLGEMYSNGEGRKRSDSEAIEWYRKAALKKYLPATSKVASCFQQGHGVIQSSDSAIVWHKKAAELGEMNSMHELGTLYSSKKEWKKAFNWYYKAAIEGNKNSYTKVGEYFVKGIGTEKSEDSALLWFSKAAKEEIRLGALKAGLILYTRKEFDKAVPLLKKEARLFDCKIASFFIADMYEHGIGVPVSSDSAQFYYDKGNNAGISNKKKKKTSSNK